MLLGPNAYEDEEVNPYDVGIPLPSPAPMSPNLGGKHSPTPKEIGVVGGGIRNEPPLSPSRKTTFTSRRPTTLPTDLRPHGRDEQRDPRVNQAYTDAKGAGDIKHRSLGRGNPGASRMLFFFFFFCIFPYSSPNTD